MKKELLILIILSLVLYMKTSAQIDPHFSQYYAYPLWLNPALTGVINGDARINANYKNQYPQLNNAYKTTALSADMRTNNNVALGINVLNQAAGDAGFNYFSAYGTFGYSITVSNDGNQKVSFGLQAGVINRSFDPNKVQFGNQFNPEGGFDPSIPSNERFLNTNTTVFDAGAGVFYYDGNPMSNANLFGGISVGHLSRPRDPFAAEGDNSKLPLRYTVHAGVRIRASEYIDVIPHAIYIKQQKAQEKAVGAYSEFKMDGDKGIIFGGMYRFNDAAVASVGYHLSSLIIGASYDFNTSSLNRATNSRGGFELSISYLFRKRISDPEPICPRL
ncbi:PorP/SprF family type IX secretion system membrane protein [Mucilaginibacter calamicampi]|uniref:PorP/SprF family type IX secretion system membrane protein n=1 Tax=Mucilaginibacter calamicampi TaxID=1302352 RepID=A0ABW2YZF6_9SPHI